MGTWTQCSSAMHNECQKDHMQAIIAKSSKAKIADEKKKLEKAKQQQKAEADKLAALAKKKKDEEKKKKEAEQKMLKHCQKECSPAKLCPLAGYAKAAGGGYYSSDSSSYFSY